MNLITPTRLSKFDKLRNRRLPLEKQAQYFTEEFKRATPKTNYGYMVSTMQPIPDDYTEETFQQGDRIKNQLQSNLDRSYAAEFAYQGSITSDTHVQVHSDIDLLTVIGVFHTVDVGTPVVSRYLGDCIADLRGLREACEEILTRKFPQVDIDTTGGKAIALSGGSLQREIDVVIANWWDTDEYKQTGLQKFRGVDILDNNAGSRIQNLPFFHNALIDSKDKKTDTGLRKAIRLLKSLKYDAEPELEISSYDIAALGYAVPDAELDVNAGEYLQLALNVNAFLKRCVSDSSFRNSLYVPNRTRLIFGANGTSLAKLMALQEELEKLLNKIDQEDSMPRVLVNEKISEFSYGQQLAPWAETRSRRVAAML